MDCGSTITPQSILPLLCAKFDGEFAYAIAAEITSQPIAATPVKCDGRTTMELLMDTIIDGPPMRVRMVATQNPAEDFITCDTTGMSLDECIRRCITNDEFGNVAFRVLLEEPGYAAQEIPCSGDAAGIPFETLLRSVFVRSSGGEEVWMRVHHSTSDPRQVSCFTAYPPLETLVLALWSGWGLYIYYP